jgi:hypothetical protein
MQTKLQKQQAALTALLARLQAEKDQRESLQVQSFRLIAPCNEELRLSGEAYNLKVKLGLNMPVEAIF